MIFHYINKINAGIVKLLLLTFLLCVPDYSMHSSIDIRNIGDAYLDLFGVEQSVRDSIMIANYAKKLLIRWIRKYEGGYQNIPEDPGNYSPNGRLLGTKHGISASFICRYKPELCSAESLKVMDEEIASSLMLGYITEKRPIHNMDSLFISIYLLYAMYYGIEIADFYVCKYYGLEPSSENAIKIYNTRFVHKRLCLYLLNTMENLINNYSCPKNPIFCNGWRRRFYETRHEILGTKYYP